MINELIIIGENLNATRKIPRQSARLTHRGEGVFLPFVDESGEEGFLDLSAAHRQAEENDDRFMPHVAEAVITRDDAWIRATAYAQMKAGADYIDLCVDGCEPSSEQRIDHMIWLIEVIAPILEDGARLALDSSDPEVLRAGLALAGKMGLRVMINSINLESGRRELIEDVARTKSLVVANASGEKGLPTTAEEKLENLTQIQDMMSEADIPMSDRFLDPLILPIATDSESGNHLFKAVGELRKLYPEVHITGGVSNVSFGLPKRGLLNDALLCLFADAGGDSAIVDPLRAGKHGPSHPGFEYAAAALKGEDLYCAEYVAFARA